MAGQDDPDLAELCAKGELAAPTAGSDQLKHVLQLIASLELDLHLLNIANAFIQGGKLQRAQGKFADPSGVLGVVASSSRGPLPCSILLLLDATLMLLPPPDADLRVQGSPPGSELLCTGIEKARCPAVRICPAGPRWV